MGYSCGLLGTTACRAFSTVNIIIWSHETYLFGLLSDHIEKMSDSEQTQGYQCEFIDSVPEDLYCKKCNLVARKFTITSCCGETFCHCCITDIQEQDKSCPVCGEKEYTTLQQIKYQKRINCLQVYCSMKERGCDWSGTLEQLDTHLNPDQDNCQYVDTKCPLNCHMTIPKNKVEQHVAQHCAKRPYVCQHCNFKATYEEVVDTHLPECKYVPLQCPNLCGVTFERDFMEDHMKMCRLEEVGCEFSGVGCDGRFRRENGEEHARQNSKKHLTLTAYLALETKEQLQQKLEQLDKRHKEEEKKLKKKLEEQEKTLEEQEQKLKEQNLLLENVSSKFQVLEKLFQEFKGASDSNEAKVTYLSQVVFSTTRTFRIANFSQEKVKNWKSAPMYTHVCGYKFCVGVYEEVFSKNLCVDVWAMPGNYDSEVSWPARMELAIELVNQQGGRNAAASSPSWTWNRPTHAYQRLGWFRRFGTYFFLERSKLGDFMVNDTLCFSVSKVKLL